jgi:16S rRNA (guanine527-N7)-methyltransferase
VQDRIRARLGEVGVGASPAEIQALADYFCLLAKWNDSINLTALPVAAGEVPAIDRLLVEPLVASRFVSPDDGLLVDLGSGGGSPAFPLKIGAPRLRLILVESRERKCAFLREVARSLAMPDVEVAQARFESLQSRADLTGQADLVSFRAVRADDAVWDTVLALLKPGGRVFWFGGPRELPAQVEDFSGPASLTILASPMLIPTASDPARTRLVILRK